MIPAGVLGPNQSYARVSDGAAEWEVKGGSSDKYVTPSTNNQTLDSNAKMEKFEEHDSVGIGMSISAMSVVFCGLILLFIAFKIVGKVIKRTNSDGSVKAAEIEKFSKSAVEFTVTGTATAVVKMSSTGGSNTSWVALVNTADGSVVANKEAVSKVTGTSATTLTYE